VSQLGIFWITVNEICTLFKDLYAYKAIFEPVKLTTMML
jgi:hypothetical protein